MSKRREYQDYLSDILDAAEKVDAFIAGMNYKQFGDDDKTVFAVIRAIEIIGETTKKIPSSVRDIAPEIPWREVAGMRD